MFFDMYAASNRMGTRDTNVNCEETDSQQAREKVYSLLSHSLLPFKHGFALVLQTSGIPILWCDCDTYQAFRRLNFH